MYDFSQPNDAPGTCCKCHGTGTYQWGAVVNGVPSKSGACFSCRGTGRQSSRQIRRNRTYNRFKMRDLAGAAANTFATLAKMPLIAGMKRMATGGDNGDLGPPRLRTAV
jgi:hypothetical protein